MAGSAPSASFAALAKRFAQVFEDEPELAALTPAARRVLVVSATLFYEQGSAATSVRDLTRACGLSPGALYNHFASRDDLLFALVRTGHLRAARDLTAALTGATGGPADELVRFVRAYTDIHLRFPPFAQLVHREYVHLTPRRKAEIIQLRRTLRDLLVGILTAGAEAGDFQLLGGTASAVGSAMMLLDMCSRTSEWFNPDQPTPAFSERYAQAALRLVGTRVD